MSKLKSLSRYCVSLLLFSILQTHLIARDPETCVEVMQKLVDDEKDCKDLLQSVRRANEIEFGVVSQLGAAASMARAYAFCIDNLSDIYLSVDSESQKQIRSTIVAYLDLVR